MTTTPTIASLILDALKDGESRRLADITHHVRRHHAYVNTSSMTIIAAMNRLRLDGDVVAVRENDGIGMSRTRYRIGDHSGYSG